jgi:hypothetical protein
MWNRILQFQIINEWISKIKIAGKFKIVTILSVYASTNDKDEAIIDEFYDNPDRAFELIPKYNVKFITGDSNTQRGVEDFMKYVAGKYTIHDTSNEYGQMLGCSLPQEIN